MSCQLAESGYATVKYHTLDNFSNLSVRRINAENA